MSNKALFFRIVSCFLTITIAKATSNYHSNKNYAFLKDVVNPVNKQAEEESSHQKLIEMLMETAQPLSDYNDQLKAKGEASIGGFSGEVFYGNEKSNHNEETTRETRKLENANDDQYNYFLDDDVVRDFSSYSFKFGKCQPIQRFSQDAAENGEYSVLVTDYMVIFRFCPSRSCNSNSQYGCSSGYGDYVIKLSNYLKAMVYYQVSNRDQLCPFCQACDFTDDYFYSDNDRKRRLEDVDDGGNNDDAGYDDAAAAYDDGAAADDGYDDADDANDGDDYTETTYSDECIANDYLCEGHTSWCFYGNDDDGNKDTLDYLDYMDYFGCVNSNGENGENGYWISPRCDSNGKITMGIFYDPYCSQYAGNDANIKEATGLKFVKNIFAFTYHGKCLSCDKNGGSPLYGTTHNLCNKIYSDAGKCNQYLAYKMDDDDSAYSSSSDIACSYIENIRHNVYDENGEIYVGSKSQSSSLKVEVTSDQKMLLSITALICLFLSLYSCFIHHEITNLLLHKLSYQGSLGPTSRSRHQSRGRREESVRDDYYSYDTDSYSYA